MEGTDLEEQLNNMMISAYVDIYEILNNHKMLIIGTLFLSYVILC